MKEKERKKELEKNREQKYHEKLLEDVEAKKAREEREAEHARKIKSEVSTFSVLSPKHLSHSRLVAVSGSPISSRTT